MNIFKNQTLQNIANKPTIQKIATQMCNHKEALLPVAMLEATVIAGRSYQAYKRGGMTECRERLIDETITAVVWLQIINWINKGLEFLIKKPGIFHKNGLPEISTDFGADAIRNPIKRATEIRPEIKKTIGGLKVSKIALSALAGIYFSGVMLPKFYQNLTKKILAKEKAEKAEKCTQPITNKISMDEFLERTSCKKPSFGAGGSKINTIAYLLESNPIAKLLTVDAGLFAGRAYSSRNNDERTEILFRDFVSCFFYMASTPLIYRFLSSKFDKFKGKNTDLDPKTASYVTKYLQENIKGQSLEKADFEKLIFGENKSIVEDMLKKFKGETIKVSDFEEAIKTLNLGEKETDRILQAANKFIDLRPKSATKTLLMRSEVANAIQGGLINNPTFLTRAVDISTNGASQINTRFASINKIENIKKNIMKFAESIGEYATKTGEKITSDLLTQIKTRNLLVKAGYTFVGLSISALFLSTLIPKLQYKLTEWRTGSKDFPGIKEIK